MAVVIATTFTTLDNVKSPSVTTQLYQTGHRPIVSISTLTVPGGHCLAPGARCCTGGADGLVVGTDVSGSGGLGVIGAGCGDVDDYEPDVAASPARVSSHHCDECAAGGPGWRGHWEIRGGASPTS